MHHVKNCGNPLRNSIKDTTTIMSNPLPELCREGLRMIVVVSLIVFLSGFPCFHDFCMVHPIPASLFFQWNDFYTCSTYFLWLAYNYIDTATCMHSCIG